MRLSSFRARVFLLSIVLAVAVIAGVLSLSYLVVTSAMQEVARAHAAGLAGPAWNAAHQAVNDAILQTRATGLTGPAARAAAYSSFVSRVPQEFGLAGGLLNGRFAFYRATSLARPVYSSDASAVVGDVAGRRRALESGGPVQTRMGGLPPLTTVLAGRPTLGTYVVHVPFQDPEARSWILDVVYEPLREEDAIRRIRLPMLLLSIGAIVMTALIMQLSLGWVLRLVDNLRSAAESVDSDELDMRLPANGDNEIADLARSLNALIDRLEKRADAQTRFVADASHELATPVAGIRGYVNILRGWGADDPVVRDESIGAIDRESRRMARLTTQLLELIRSEEAMELHSVRHDVNSVVRSVLGQTASRYAAKRLEFIGPDPGPLVLFGDPERMEDVLSILVDNAAKYTPQGGRISVQTYRRKGDIVIEVSDTGPGIPPEDLPSIFDRFYRSDASRSADTGGFGLGLAIAKRIVDSSGGLIDVRSRPGKGTTFTIRLPRGRD